MFATHETTQNLEVTRIAVLALAAAMVVYWRTVIRFVIMALATAVIALLGFGVFMLWESTHG